jgi:hypothetical protein
VISLKLSPSNPGQMTISIIFWGRKAPFLLVFADPVLPELSHVESDQIV